jgi:hypothetical protein
LAKEHNSKVIAESRRLDHLFEVKIQDRPLFLFSPRFLGCDGLKKIQPLTYPKWNESGIDVDPIFRHINRVVEATETVVLLPAYERVPDYRQGPEVPYIVDEKGIWSSRLIRSRTENATYVWRLVPTEDNNLLAHRILSQEPEGNSRWPAAMNNMKKSGFFYWAWYGDYKTCNHHNRDDESIPLFTTCATRSCDSTFPVPNYMNIIDTQTSPENWRGVFREFEQHFPWKNKIDKIVWRGALSEAEWRYALTSVRWRVNKLVNQLRFSGSYIYDVGLTGIPFWLTEKMTFNLTEVGGFFPGLSPMTNFMQYKAVLDMDGNSWSSRFGTLLCYNTVVVKVEPKFYEYFYPELKPWKHYVPVKNDLSDFHENIAWILDPKNEKVMLDIIESANNWCAHRLLPEELARDQLDIWESYNRRLDRHDPNWIEKFQRVKRELFGRKDFDIIKIESEFERSKL